MRSLKVSVAAVIEGVLATILGAIAVSATGSLGGFLLSLWTSDRVWMAIVIGAMNAVSLAASLFVMRRAFARESIRPKSYACANLADAGGTFTLHTVLVGSGKLWSEWRCRFVRAQFRLEPRLAAKTIERLHPDRIGNGDLEFTLQTDLSASEVAAVKQALATLPWVTVEEWLFETEHGTLRFREEHVRLALD